MKINRKKRIRLTEAQLRHAIKEAIIQELPAIVDTFCKTPYVQIFNAKGTGGEQPDNDTSWRDYWEKETRKQLEDLLPMSKEGKFQCPTHDHHEKDNGYVDMKDICGCYVQIVGVNGVKYKQMYIVPMCRGCKIKERISSHYLDSYYYLYNIRD